MARHTPKRKCKHCQTFFVPDPRCVRRQRHCSTPACRKASKADSQRRWHHKPDNRDYFKGPIHVERVRAWRQAHPGYWRRKASGLPHALQDDLMPQPSQKQLVDDTLTAGALQDDLFRQPAVLVGLIAHLTGLALQEDIAMTARRLQQLGRDILSGSLYPPGGRFHAQTPHLIRQTQNDPEPVQLGGPALGP